MGDHDPLRTAGGPGRVLQQGQVRRCGMNVRRCHGALSAKPFDSEPFCLVTDPGPPRVAQPFDQVPSGNHHPWFGVARQGSQPVVASGTPWRISGYRDSARNEHREKGDDVVEPGRQQEQDALARVSPSTKTSRGGSHPLRKFGEVDFFNSISRAKEAIR